MTRAAFAMLICMSASPALAQDVPNADLPDAEQPNAELNQGVDLMQEGAKLLLKGLLTNIEPAMQDLGQALGEMQPALNELLTMMGDVTKYHAPEMQENGDIIIRRKTPAELAPSPNEIDL